MTGNETARRYARALETADAVASIELLTESAVFVSPFSEWTTRARVEAACSARTRAFTGLTVGSVVADGVFLRPADVLDTAYRAMSAAWRQ